MIGPGFMLALTMQAAQPAGPAALPEWMAGCWEARDGARVTEECWTDARGGIMLGTNRTVADGTLAGWEVMQIVAGQDGPVFWASPGGAARSAFPAAAGATAQDIAFVNAAHDYPQRVRYWREGAELLAQISLADGREARRWRFRRVAR